MRKNPGAVPRAIPVWEKDLNVPSSFALLQNYPNPFNPTTTIAFTLPADMMVSLKIYNMLGQEVATLLDREQYDAGPQIVQFDGSNLASGVYFYRIAAASQDEHQLMFSAVKKMVLVR